MGFPAAIATAAAAAAKAILGLVDVVKIGDLPVSALTSLSNPSELRVTRKPIGSGYAITDAAVDVPREITMGVCLADPQFTPDEIAAALLSGTLSSLTESHRDKRAALEQKKEDRELFALQTHEGVYFNMLIQSIDPIWDVDSNWDAFFASVTMVQISISDILDAGGILDQIEQSMGGL